MTAPPTRTPRQVMETWLLDVARDGRLELIEEIVAEDAVDEANAAFGGPPGRAGMVAHARGFRRNVADLTVEVRRIVAAEDEVMAWWAFQGRHVGPWMGVAPTGETIRGTVFSFFELREGLVSRYRLWLWTDLDGGIVVDSAVGPVLAQGR